MRCGGVVALALALALGAAIFNAPPRPPAAAGCCYWLAADRTWRPAAAAGAGAALPVCPNCVPLDPRGAPQPREVRCERCPRPPCDHPALPRCAGEAWVRGGPPPRGAAAGGGRWRISGAATTARRPGRATAEP